MQDHYPKVTFLLFVQQNQYDSLQTIALTLLVVELH